ncbi:pantoate--beta-alanine ligase [Salicibibacter halophilus]|uniref:Pantothenate synthetase n=1 Tax=Salicibibacter halophilus TaxID=2502791 RepID=A0A514LDQ1_9BACI|nr:pantoate--beta-alanine ligase [Salicibibacter halophilus]QDI89979.1 pantoate--beta-alanine ligase [Salicibibacter halophilus]
MLICRTKQEWLDGRARMEGYGSIALVPTMGALHQGHLQLAEQANADHDQVVMTVFVNPLQFGEGEDFEHYPRQEEKDIEKAKAAGVDVLWLPAVEDIYAREPAVTVKVGQMSERLCGRHRSGHFDGMATVVMKFLQLVRPHAAYFGKKDGQQLAILTRMCEDLHLDVEVVGGETVREEDGLALSSRNVFLRDDERKEAPLLYKTLQEGYERIRHQNENPLNVEHETFAKLSERITASIDYVELWTYPGLEPLHENNTDEQLILAAAVRYSQARFIDNVIFKRP